MEACSLIPDMSCISDQGRQKAYRKDTSRMATRILLVDNHRLVIEGLWAILNREDDLEVVGMASTGRIALEMVAEQQPDIVVMDISMPDLNGIEATSQIVSQYPQVKVIALSAHRDKRYVRAMLEAGTHGFVVKDTASTELLQAIKSVKDGQKYLSSNVTDAVIDGYVNGDAAESTVMTSLGSREREILQLIAEGYTSGEIASQLHISTNTVDTHRRNIMKKLDLHSVADLTRYAIREGLTDVNQ